MSTVVDKQVQIAAERAQRLTQLAAAKGVTENALLEKALDLLFQEQEEAVDIEAELQADRELLHQFEAEYGPLSAAAPRETLHLEGATVTHGVSLAPHKIRRGDKN